MKRLIFIFLSLWQIQAWAAVAVKSAQISGFSYTDSDLKTYYAGIAGKACTGDGVNLCNSCTETTLPLKACNPFSVYASMPITVTFQVSADATTGTRIELFTDPVTASVLPDSLGFGTLSGTSGTLTTTWLQLCNRMAGMDLPCGSSTITDPTTFSKKLYFGVDSNNSGDVGTDEMYSVNVRFQFIPETPATPTTISQPFCANISAATGAGICNLKILAGDEKAFIMDAIYKGADNSGLDWDGVAVFPISVALGGSGDATAFTNFTSGSVAPIIRAVSIASGVATVSDSQITGGNLQNYKRYCFVHANKNKTQNIYRFVNDTAAASSACVTLSENVGLLADKHCFISTAAFGSDMASEVQIFREFRNQFLLGHDLGKLFVKAYYKFSPPMADVIAKNDYLRALTRAALYPVLGFSYVALHYGLLVAILSVMVLLILLFQVRKAFRSKPVVFFLILFLAAPFLKAAETAEEVKIPHSESRNGLTRIRKDGSYIYKIERTTGTKSSRISFGQAQDPVIGIDIEKRNEDGSGTGQFQNFTFKDFYGGASNLMIGYDYEWFPWAGSKGKLGLQGGGSLMYAQGNGIQTADFTKSVEKYTFITLPVSVGAVYRLEWKDKQLFVPYATGGGTYVLLAEKREDRSKVNYVAAPGFYAAGGGLINLGVLDAESDYALDSEYGISNLWVSVEYRLMEVNSDAFSLSNRYLNVGLSFDF